MTKRPPYSVVHGCLATIPSSKGTTFLGGTLIYLFMLIIINNIKLFSEKCVFNHTLYWPLFYKSSKPLQAVRYSDFITVEGVMPNNTHDKIKVKHDLKWLIALLSLRIKQAAFVTVPSRLMYSN